ncbi:ketopantoate reductase family protein [Mangrovicoccus ximenensis]|uniref:ketopantoate reductase family protein n=1 Tax=Mangrovicoccus ximenensis TaxID=1911570 RepID=UPI000D3C68CE|nr:2-dehydropantoate 2-reductase N-terminal domain-containing protein [Mangrovicoccus ximenensis]
MRCAPASCRARSSASSARRPGRPTRAAARPRARSPAERIEARIPVAADPAGLGLGAEDVILLAVKTQDSTAALERLAAAGLRDQPVYCTQNGLANEPLAARYFPNIHGVNVMMPCAIAGPGHVRTFVGPRFGMFDIGCWPGGTDASDKALAGALRAGNVACETWDDVMVWKRGKLLLNLSNVIDAAVGPEAEDAAIRKAARDEAEAVYRALGLGWRTIDADDPRREQIRPGEIAGARALPHAGRTPERSCGPALRPGTRCRREVRGPCHAPDTARPRGAAATGTSRGHAVATP